LLNGQEQRLTLERFLIDIAFNKMFAAPECQTYSLAGANRGPPPNCKFGTPDNVYVKSSMLLNSERKDSKKGIC
jgi:hypothetical protein